MTWSGPAEDQIAYLTAGKPEAFTQRVRKRAEAITERIGAASVGWVEVQEAVQQIETEDERRR